MKEKEAKVLKIMEALEIATKHNVAEILAHVGDYSEGVSSVNNSKKLLDGLFDLDKLERVNGFYRIKGNKSEGGDHAQALTNVLVQFLKLPYEVTIIRERKIKDINLIPDAIILLKDDDKGCVLILECVRNETEQYLTSKQNAWENWANAKKHLSRTFGYKIKSFEFVVQREGEAVWKRF
jgi:hypothetical protein